MVDQSRFDDRLSKIHAKIIMFQLGASVLGRTGDDMKKIGKIFQNRAWAVFSFVFVFTLLLPFFEKVAYARGSDADEHFHERYPGE